MPERTQTPLERLEELRARYPSGPNIDPPPPAPHDVLEALKITRARIEGDPAVQRLLQEACDERSARQLNILELDHQGLELRIEEITPPGPREIAYRDAVERIQREGLEALGLTAEQLNRPGSTRGQLEGGSDGSTR